MLTTMTGPVVLYGNEQIHGDIVGVEIRLST